MPVIGEKRGSGRSEREQHSVAPHFLQADFSGLIRTVEAGYVPVSRRSGNDDGTDFYVPFVILVVGMAIYLFSVRDSVHSYSGNNEESLMAPNTNNGILNNRSNYSVDETLVRLKQTLQGKGVTIFAIVDHSGEAEKVGLIMRPTKLVIFGSPKAGTPLMLAAPSIAIDLPLKILISEDRGGKVWVSYNSLTYLQERHGLPQELLQDIAVVETLAAAVAE